SLEGKLALLQLNANLIIRKLRTRISSQHYVTQIISLWLFVVTQTVTLPLFLSHTLSRTHCPHYAVMDLIANAQRGATVTRSRLHIHTTKRRVEQNLAVHNRVVGHTARQTEIRQTGLSVQVIQNVKPNFLQTQLQA